MDREKKRSIYDDLKSAELLTTFLHNVGIAQFSAQTFHSNVIMPNVTFLFLETFLFLKHICQKHFSLCSHMAEDDKCKLKLNFFCVLIRKIFHIQKFHCDCAEIITVPERRHKCWLFFLVCRAFGRHSKYSILQINGLTSKNRNAFRIGFIENTPCTY